MDGFVCGRLTEGGSPSSQHDPVALFGQEPEFAQFQGEQTADFGRVRMAHRPLR